MFTGLVEEQGAVLEVEPRPDGRRFWLGARAVRKDLRVGDSVACSGCCLTVVELRPERFAVEAVPETLRRTTLGDWSSDTRVNLERSLRFGDRLGGHLVQGHVDATGTVTQVVTEGDGRRVTFELPHELRRFVAWKGSLSVDGVSLTVAGLTDTGCEIAYIPHTLAVTTAGAYRAGTRVNLEVDLLARYLARMLETASEGPRP